MQCAAHAVGASADQENRPVPDQHVRKIQGAPRPVAPCAAIVFNQPPSVGKLMKKIIIADAIKTVIINGNSFLRRSDIQVLIFRTNDELLEIHRQEKANLIITSLDMPGMINDELYALIRNDSELRQVSLIMLCADNAAERERAERCKPNAVLTLPLDVDLLIEKAQQFLNISGRESYRVLLSVKIDGNNKDRSFFCKSENISATGLLLETDRVLSKGDRVLCSFFLPGSHRISLTGEVVRDMKKASGTAVNRYGIRFFKVSADDKAAIEQFVDKKAQMNRS